MTLRGDAAESPAYRIAAWSCATPRTRRHSGRRCATSSRPTCPTARRSAGARRFEDADREWSRKLGEAGYAGLTWPKEYGGAGAPYSHQAIFLEELARAEAPSHLGVIGLGMAGPTIIAWGTDAQKERYLSKILMADEIWCQGFSEPDAGSDLAASRTRIEDKGDHFLVNGQKVWSSFAHIADFCILVGLGDPDAPRYKNLTYVIVDMHAPGVEVRPLVQITGHPEFNEIFFTDVKVPKENLLGNVGDGWQVAMTTLLHERGTLGFALSATLDVAVRKLIALAKERKVTDPILLDRIAREWVELQALKYTNYRSLTALQKTGVPGPEGSASKLVWSENNQRLTKLALEILGSHAQLTNGGGYADGYWQYQQLRSRGNTIEAGTSEILRNIIAERVLGLPRSQVMDFSFTPEQDDLRREARAFLEANPSPSMEQLAELGWVGILQTRRLHVPRRGGDLRGARTRALRRAVRAERGRGPAGRRGLVDRDRRLRAAPRPGHPGADGRHARRRRFR